MAVYHYKWGTERPKAWEQRHERVVNEVAVQARIEAEREFEERCARIDKMVEASKREIEFVRAVTPGGRYNKELAERVAGVQAVAQPVKRGRGRPRKYGPDNPPPPRKSRAKVRLVSSERSNRASETRSSSAGRRASSRTTSGTVSPVTAAPARIPTPAPKAAPKVAAALLESTLAGGLGVDTIQIEAPETAFEI
jgi:hypothetical protein